MKTVTIPESEYKNLKKKAELDEDLLMKLIRCLEDIKAGRIKPWKSLKLKRKVRLIKPLKK